MFLGSKLTKHCLTTFHFNNILTEMLTANYNISFHRTHRITEQDRSKRIEK